MPSLNRKSLARTLLVACALSVVTGAEIQTSGSDIERNLETDALVLEPEITAEDTERLTELPPPTEVEADVAPDVAADTTTDTTTTSTTTTNPYNNPTPKIGPWPECLGWQGEDCATYISQEIDDNPEIAIIRPGTPEIHRVFVVVDQYNVVVKVPHRG